MRKSIRLLLVFPLLLGPLLSPAALADDAKKPAAPAPPAKGDAPGDPFPGVSKEDLAGTAEKRKMPPEDPFKSNLSDLTETTVDGALLDPAVVRKLIDRVQPAIVKITHLSRDGHILGTGSGFLLSKSGLVATNQHVIGTARPMKVELFDGTEYEVAAVHAWDRHLDLAILQLDAGDRELPFLDLADPASIEQGEPILGFGNPQGLKFSVVSGLVSAIRKLDAEIAVEGETPDFPLIQVAMPIEMGNSGGPIVDLEGRVLGIVTIKNIATPNLGFAVPAEHLTPLLDQPNTVPMSRWLTFGALDPAIWTTAMGARWTQRGGIIQAEGLGGGFGGRALCLSERPTPGSPYEIAVEVKLDDESGAAGLAFASDGGDKHYGFYPSEGQIRLTRFEGADIYSWTILQQIPTDAYKPGGWNELRVRVTDDKITGFVNGTQILEIEESVLRGGQVGLCKFRQTVAEFRHFKSGANLGPATLSGEALSAVTREIDGFAADGQRTDDRLATLAKASAPSRELLLARAKELETRAAAMRELTEELHLHEVAAGLSGELGKKEIDLFRAGLHIARLDEPELDFGYYAELFDRLTDEARTAIDKKPVAADDREKVRRLATFLFEESGFHGSRSEYYHPGNSYLNEVLEYREGLPITLSIVFIELARRLGIPGVEGIPLPGHFLVGHRDAKADPPLALIDVYEGGKIISRKEAEDLAWAVTRSFPTERDFEASPPREIIVRMLRNLVGLDMQDSRPADALPYIELILTVAPEETQERFQRALLRVQEKNIDGAKIDLDWLLEHRPPGIDYDRLQGFRDQLDQAPAASIDALK